ncbi:MAG: hypothetical protein MUO53_15450 [Maribacter sp.]|nr:hypothetical protein [Maribacter sp.]
MSASLEFGSIFNRSIDLFKKVWLQGFITLLLTFVSMLPFYALFCVPFLLAGITDPGMIPASDDLPPAVFIPLVIFSPFLLIASMVISIAFNAAFLRICKQKDYNEAIGEAYFFYFKKSYLGKMALLSVMMFGLSLLGMLACGVGLIYMVVPLALIPAFLAFNEELSASDIVKASFALGNKNWLVIFGLVFLVGILAELGILLCIVGVLFTAMLAKIPIYYIYKDSIGFSAQP